MLKVGKSSMRNPKIKNAECQYNKDFNMLYILKHCDLDQMAEVSKMQRCSRSKIRGERRGKYKVKDLLYGLMLESYNDCAVVLAEHAEGSVEKILKKRMNQMAEKSRYF